MAHGKGLLLPLLGLLALGANVTDLRGQEPPPPKPPPQEGDDAPPHAKRQKEMRELKELMVKRREEAPPDGERPRKFGRFEPDASQELTGLLADLNVVDRAALCAAQALWQAGKRDDALAAAEKVAVKSPDAEAAGAARLLAGRWCQEKGDQDAANKYLRGVTGRAAPQAMVSLAEPLLKKQAAPELVAAAKELMAAQPAGLDRCRVLKAMLDLLERPGQELDAQLRADVAGALAALVPYEEALAAKEALAKERAAAPRPTFPPFGPPPGFGPGMFAPGGMGGPGMGGPFNEADLPPDLRNKARAFREMPPEQRREAIQNFKGEIKNRMEAFEKEGRAEDGEKLKRVLEQIERIEEKMKGHKGGGGGGPQRDPEQIKAEIKKLEDQGFQEEAEKLRKELEGMHPKAAENF